MKRKRAAAFGGWLLMEGFFGLIAFWNSSIYGLICAVIWLVLPLVSVTENFFLRNALTAKLLVPATASKGTLVEGVVEIRNGAIFPVGHLLCRLSLVNQLTGEREESWLSLSAAAKGRTQTRFELKSAYCGYLTLEIRELVLLDWFGFLGVSRKVDAKGKVSILPDTFEANVSVGISYVSAQDADNWSPYVKGNDYTEVFALREYVPGDSLKQIHWKLSSKFGQLIVKEPSLPLEKSLLLFWDKNAGTAKPEEMDAMAEVVASVGQALAAQGIYFTLGWTEGRSMVMEDADGEEALLQLIPRMVKAGALSEEDRQEEAIGFSEERTAYGKVLYFAKAIPEYALPFSGADITALLCSTGEAASEWKTFYYSPKTYMEDLQAAEL